MKIENIFVKYVKLRENLDNLKIYRITDNTNNNICIGSACNTLKKRLLEHKRSCKKTMKWYWG